MRSSSQICRAPGVLGHEPVGEDVREVADEDRDPFAEPPCLAVPVVAVVHVAEGEVRGAPTPPDRGAVHDVVVDERERLEQLQRGAGVDDRVVVGSPPPAT